MAPPPDVKRDNVSPDKVILPLVIVPKVDPEGKPLRFPSSIELNPSPVDGSAPKPLVISTALPPTQMNNISTDLKSSVEHPVDTNRTKMAVALDQFKSQVDELEKQALAAVGNDPKRIKEAVEQIYKPAAGKDFEGMTIEQQKHVLTELIETAARSHFERYFVDPNGFNGGATPEALVRSRANAMWGSKDPSAPFQSIQTFKPEMLDIVREWNPTDAAKDIFRLGKTFPLVAEYHLDMARKHGVMDALNGEFEKLPENKARLAMPRHLEGMALHSYEGVVKIAVGADVGQRTHEFYKEANRWTSDAEPLAKIVREAGDIKDGVARNPDRLLAVASAFEKYYQNLYDSEYNFRETVKYELKDSPHLKEIDGAIALAQIAAQKKADEQYFTPVMTKAAESIKGAEDRNTQFTNAEKALRAMEAQLLSDDPEFQLKLNQGDKKDPNSICSRFLKLRAELPQYAPEVTNKAREEFQANAQSSNQELEQIKKGIGEVERDTLKSRLDQFVESGEKRAQAEQAYVSKIVARTTDLEKFIGEVQRSPKPAEGAVTIDVQEQQERDKEQQRVAEKEKKGVELGYGSLSYAQSLVARGEEAQAKMDRKETVSKEDQLLAHMLRRPKETFDVLVGDLDNPQKNALGHVLAGRYVNEEWTQSPESARYLVQAQTLAYYRGEKGVEEQRVFSGKTDAKQEDPAEMRSQGNKKTPRAGTQQRAALQALMETELNREKA